MSYEFYLNKYNVPTVESYLLCLRLGFYRSFEGTPLKGFLTGSFNFEFGVPHETAFVKQVWEDLKLFNWSLPPAAQAEGQNMLQQRNSRWQLLVTMSKCSWDSHKAKLLRYSSQFYGKPAPVMPKLLVSLKQDANDVLNSVNSCKVWKCTICPESFALFSDLRVHETISHKFTDAVYEQFRSERRCPFCKATYQHNCSTSVKARNHFVFQPLRRHFQKKSGIACLRAYQSWRASRPKDDLDGIHHPIPVIPRDGSATFVATQWKEYHRTKTRKKLYKNNVKLIQPLDPEPQVRTKAQKNSIAKERYVSVYKRTKKVKPPGRSRKLPKAVKKSKVGKNCISAKPIKPVLGVLSAKIAPALDPGSIQVAVKASRRDVRPAKRAKIGGR
jgi:hypothetical protein